MKSFFGLKSSSRRSTTSRNGALRKGFTLIELLIVIAIILILISIALPNFLEAQMRAKVAKCKGEIRSITTSLESYYLDFKIYPAESEDNALQRVRLQRGLFWLTTPIKYMSTIPRDVFAKQDTDGGVLFYEFGGLERNLVGMKCMQCLETWAIFTQGPDADEHDVRSSDPHVLMYEDDYSVDSYSPTNGSTSKGDIFQFGGDPFWIGVRAGSANRSKYTPAWNSPLVVDREVYLHRLPPKLR